LEIEYWRCRVDVFDDWLDLERERTPVNVDFLHPRRRINPTCDVVVEDFIYVI
jgi:hypothetical protein